MSSIRRTSIGRISFFPETTNESEAMSNFDDFEFYLKFKQNAPPLRDLTNGLCLGQ